MSRIHRIRKEEGSNNRRGVSAGMEDAVEKIPVLIADDHQVVRIGLRAVLEANEDFAVVGEATTGTEAITQVAALQPEIVLMDIVMPEMTGIEATRQLRKQYPDLLIVMMTSLEDRFHLQKAMEAGAMGYLTKDIDPEELYQCLYKVLEGSRVYSRNILRMMNDPNAPVFSDFADVRTIELTKREQEILRLLAAGLTSKEIGERLFISPRTVDTHRARLMEKLNARNVADLVRFAMLHLW